LTDRCLCDRSFSGAVIEPQNRPASTKYNLVANVCHEGKPGVGAGTYKVYVQSHGREQWFQMQDLIVEEILPQMIFLSESYLQVNEG
jgi:U4/U6.U5 tri-snRNP-associated protein 2